MAARHADVGPGDRRWFKRAAPAEPVVELSCAGGGVAREAALVDISTYGCRLRGPDVEETGDHVRLKLGHGPAVPATVVWRGEGLVGCRFDRPIATSLMRAMICHEG